MRFEDTGVSLSPSRAPQWMCEAVMASIFDVPDKTELTLRVPHLQGPELSISDMCSSSLCIKFSLQRVPKSRSTERMRDRSLDLSASCD